MAIPRGSSMSRYAGRSRSGGMSIALSQVLPAGPLMIDVVVFRSPGGPLGSLVDRVLLVRYMTKLISQRNAWLRRTLEDSI